MPIGEITIIVVLILINGFFSMSEMAIVSASRPLLRQMAKSGNRRATIVIALAEDSGRFLSTIQIGITLVGTLAGAYGGAAVADALAPHLDAVDWIAPHGSSVAVALVVGVITYLSVVIGELVPKRIALRSPETIALFAAPPMAVIARIGTPVVWLLNTSAAGLMRIFGLGGEKTDAVTEEEVKAILAEGAESGVIEKEEHEMLSRLLRLGDRDIGSIMTHRTDLVVLNADDPLWKVRSQILGGGHARYPVIDDHPDHIIGIVHARWLVTSHAEGFSLRNYLEPVPSIPLGTSALKAFEFFKSGESEIAVVVNEYGTPQGIVTAADLLEAITGLLPTNYEGAQHQMIRAREEGGFLVDGAAPIEEVATALGLENLSADGFHTIAGFVLKLLGKSPEEGVSVEHQGWRFEIVDMDGARIDKLMINPSG